jgi:hypothetical protein
MSDASDDLNSQYTEQESEVTQSGKGKGKSGKGGSGGGIRLPPNKIKEVHSDWEFLDATKVVARLAEFFSELPARASANLEVSWANIKNQGHAIVTHLLRTAEVSRLMFNLTRENLDRLRREFGINIAGPSAG